MVHSGPAPHRPRATRTGQYVHRSVLSPGPTISPRPHVDRALAERLRVDRLAPRLHRPVLAHALHIRRRQLPHRVALVDADDRIVRVGRDRGHEQVAVHVALQQLGGHRHPARDRGRIVYHRVPFAPLERAQVVVTVAGQLLDALEVVLEERRLRLATGEDGHLVAAVQRVLHLVRADEAGAAEDEDAHRVGRGRMSPPAMSPSPGIAHARGPKAPITPSAPPARTEFFTKSRLVWFDIFTASSSSLPYAGELPTPLRVNCPAEGPWYPRPVPSRHLPRPRARHLPQPPPRPTTVSQEPWALGAAGDRWRDEGRRPLPGGQDGGS